MQELIKILIKENIKFNEEVNIKKYTSYNIGGIVKLMAFPKKREELISILKIVKKNDIKHIVLGECSNIIFTSDYYDGVVIKTDYLSNIIIEDNTVICDAGVKLVNLSLNLSKKGLSNFEFASGIPGTVGGGIYMNAGAYNISISDHLIEANILDNNFNIITLKNDELKFDYRYSMLKENKYLIVLGGKFRLKSGDKDEILDLIYDRKRRRLESQPLEYPNAGSVFRNPDNNFAGKLIEDLNLKGFSIGGAKISEKHANFIINDGEATSKDIKKLAEYIKKLVKENYDIELHMEQEFIK
ncbi:MAG: UDP-N-acetylmuramate dehydrogenase [Bacilli bacterium]